MAIFQLYMFITHCNISTLCVYNTWQYLRLKAIVFIKDIIQTEVYFLYYNYTTFKLIGCWFISFFVLVGIVEKWKSKIGRGCKEKGKGPKYPPLLSKGL